MTNVWVVRSEYGKYTEHFIKGGYVATGWIPEENLSDIQSRDEIELFYRKAYPNDTNRRVGANVYQIKAFLLDIQTGDYVITPPDNTEWLNYGQVAPDGSCYYSNVDDGCPFPHRRKVNWAESQLRRLEFSVPFQNTMRAAKTVFSISQRGEFLDKIGRGELAPKARTLREDPYRVVLDRILELDAQEFEILVGHLLEALGFEGPEVTGKPGDGGVDATGELNVSNLAKVKIFVQAKRYRLGSKVGSNAVKQLRSAIPFGGQGAFITTADYATKAKDVAIEPDFPRIGLINGHQLVDLLIQYWDSIDEEFRDGLGLRPGLVRQ